MMLSEGSESGRHAVPVSQNQIRQREEHMQFGLLLSSALVACLSEAKQALNYAMPIPNPSIGNSLHQMPVIN